MLYSGIFRTIIIYCNILCGFSHTPLISVSNKHRQGQELEWTEYKNSWKKSNRQSVFICILAVCFIWRWHKWNWV